MRIVQSCWACNQPNLLDSPAGWYGAEYNLMSWALSCLQLRKYYDDVVLYADSVSARTLLDELRLPYSEVCCELDSLGSFNPKLWALPKIYAYSKQETPFLHVDSDVYIWEAFDQGLLAAGLIAQNIETETDYYEGIWRGLEKTLAFFPTELMEERKAAGRIVACNTGILGGSNLDFFEEYTAKALEFVDRNTRCFDTKNVIDFNLFFEQYLFYCMARSKGKSVSVLLPEMAGGEEYWVLGDFAEVPYNRKYLHLLGRLKTFGATCDQLANRLRLDYPEYFYRIIALFKKSGLPLKKESYSVFASFSEEELIKTHAELTASFSGGKLSLMDGGHHRLGFVNPELRIGLVTEAVDKAVASSGEERQGFTQQLTDVAKFESTLCDILKEKFSRYSPEYLYARDIAGSGAIEVVFGKGPLGYDIEMIADAGYEIVESHFDWSEIELGEYGQEMLLQQLQSPPSPKYTVIIPECHEGGYSLENVDLLDVQLLALFSEPNTIRSVLLAIESSFDAGELTDARAEFEALIAGRIKRALKNKLLKLYHKSHENAKHPALSSL